MCVLQDRRLALVRLTGAELEAAARAARRALGPGAARAVVDEFWLCYFECLSRGRLDLWRRAGEGVAGAGPEPEVPGIAGVKGPGL
jgi:hypothetical protein